MKSLILMSMVPVAVALRTTAEQDLGGSGTREESGWRCGHTAGKDNDNGNLINENAGIVFLRDGSLNYLRTIDDPVRPISNDLMRERLNTDTQSLFCGSYISRYRNPLVNGTGGVCIRNITRGGEWDSIVEADTEVRELHAWFATENGYQKSVRAEHSPPNPDHSSLWGSGRSGDSPDNWCHEYMKEMLCHIAFPQWAGNTEELANLNTAAPRGQLVRPVNKDTCSSIMDNCNRREPDPFSQELFWMAPLDGVEDTKQDLSNSFFCEAWNRGLNISKAGTGVGEGGDGAEAEFTAEWEASSNLSPLGLVAVILSFLAIVL